MSAHRLLLLGCIMALAPHACHAAHFQVTELAPDLLLLSTDQGSYSNNSLVFTGPDGVLLVDTHTDDDAAALKAFVDSLGLDAPRYIISTHRHAEHIGGTAVFGPEPVVVAHEDFADRLRSSTYLFSEYPPETFPDVTVADSLTIVFNGEVIRLVDIGGSHDDNEIMVHFTRHGIAHCSSVVNGFCFPSVDGDGDVRRFEPIVRRLMVELPPGTSIVSGHHGQAAGYDTVGSWDQLEPYAEMMHATIAIVRGELDAGRTVAEMQAAGVLDDYADYAGSYVGTDGWIETVADALTEPRRDLKDVCKPVYAAWKAEGAAAAVAVYQNLQQTEPDAYEFHEFYLMGAGAKLAARGFHADASIFLQGCLDRHPDGDYAYYTEFLLAQSLQAQGLSGPAQEHCRRSLALKPEFAAPAALLTELEAQD